MTDVLEKWLLNFIGVNIDLSPSILGDLCFDGTLYAKILLKYNVCNHTYVKDIIHTKRNDIALTNLKKMCVWFKLLGISYDDELLWDISNKKNSSALKLLYELFIRLEGRENMRLRDWKTKERILSESTSKFNLERVPEPKPQFDITNEKQYLHDALKEGATTVGIFIDKERNFIEKCKLESEKRRAVIRDQLRHDAAFSSILKAQDLCPKCESNADLFKQIEFFDKLSNSPERKMDARNVVNCKPKEFISVLKVSRRKANADRLLKEKMVEQTFNETWRKLLSAKEKSFRDFLAKKLLQLGQYEKQMILRLSRSRLRYKSFIENRQKILDHEQKHNRVNNFLKIHRGSSKSSEKEIEEARLQELKGRLLSELNNIKYQKNYEACHSVLEDTVDFAILLQEYRNEFKVDPTKKTLLGWKLLFIKGLPLFECHANDFHMTLYSVEGILIDNVCSDTYAEYEFHLYNCLIGPWDVDNFPELLEYETEKLNQIGFIVHQLLDLKYPFEMSFDKPAEVLQYDIQVLLTPVKSLFLKDTLQGLLKKSKIAVIDVNVATDYVIRSYSKYVTVNKINKGMKGPRYTTWLQTDSFVPVSSRAEKKRTFIMKTSIKKEGKKKDTAKLHDISVQVPFMEPSHNDVPRVVALGRVVQYYLSEGLPMSDVLTCQIILEYIKSLENINGWVLINYPQNLMQVATLSYIFTGIEVPYVHKFPNLRFKLKNELKYIDDQILSIYKKRQSIEENEKLKKEMLEKVGDDVDESFTEVFMVHSDTSLSEDPLYRSTFGSSDVTNKEFINEQGRLSQPSLSEIALWKRSNILPKPNPDSPIPHFKSIFTKVIQLEGPNDLNSQDLEMDVIDFENEQDDFIEKDSLFSRKLFDGVYGELQILQRFCYKKLSPETCTKLGRIILNEPLNERDPHWKNNIDLFGFDRFVNFNPVRIIHDETSIRLPQIEISDLFKGPVYQRPDLETLTKTLYRVEDESASVGSEELDETEITYTPLSETIKLKDYYEQLASIWESIEFHYVNNVSESLNLLRIIGLKLLPYKNYIMRKADECVNIPDDRGRVASNFQVMLNSISADLRPVKTMKNELHYRAYKLQSELWKFSNVKKLLGLEILRRLKEENWLSKRMCNYLRGYTFLLQTEVDRCVNTMQFLSDVYCLTTSGLPSGSRIKPIHLPLYEWERNVEEEVKEITPVKPPTSYTKGHNYSKKLDDTASRYHFNANDDPLIVYCTEAIGNNYMTAIDTLNKQIDKLEVRINIVKDFCIMIFDENMNVQMGGKKSSRRLSRSSNSRSQKKRQTTGMDGVYMDWFCALEEEINRVMFRINLIRSEANKNMKAQIKEIESTFNRFEQEILEQYHKELINIDNVYDLLRVAIEEEAKIQPAIILDHKRFYVDPDKLMYPSPPPPAPRELCEVGFGNQFTVFQMINFTNKMSYAVPLGVLKGTFIYILHDMTNLGHELGRPYLPKIWSTFSIEKITQLINNWFGNKSVICWKDFIIFALDFRYPSLEEIINMKQQFEAYDPQHSELITFQQFSNCDLWYENQEALGLEQTLRCSKMKELLFKLFQVYNNKMNYTCFLLQICRDYDPPKGFIKALAAVEGHITVTWSPNMAYSKNQVEKPIEKYSFVANIVNKLIENVCQIIDLLVRDDIDTKEKDLLDFLPIAPEPSKVSTTENTAEEQIDNESNDYDKKLNQGTLYSARSETESVKPQVIEDWKTYLTNFSPAPSFEDSEVHFDTVLSLFVFYLQYYAVSPNHAYQHLRLERNLNKIFTEKGNGYTIKVGALLEDSFIKRLLSSYRLFQAINISEYLNIDGKVDTTIREEYELQRLF